MSLCTVIDIHIINIHRFQDELHDNQNGLPMEVQTSTGTRSTHVQWMLYVWINHRCEHIMSWCGKTVKIHSNKSQIHPNSQLLINDNQRTLVRPSVVQSLDLALLPCRPSSHLYLKSHMGWRSYDMGSWELQGRFVTGPLGCPSIFLQVKANMFEAIIQKPVISSFST